MKKINYLFYLVLFLGFFLPSNSSFFISFIGVELQVREVAFLLLPIINLFCSSIKKVKIADKKLQFLILFLIGLVVITETLKHLYYGGGFGAASKTIRIGLPLFSCLLILFVGIRANIEKIWFTLLWAISASAVLTIITPFVDLPIYPTIEGENFLEANSGRFTNSNASFGIIGLYLLYSDQDKWYNQGMLPKITAILSIVILILTFNRTYFALLSIGFVYLTFSSFSTKRALKFISIPVISVLSFFIAYNYTDAIQRQVDNRILNILYGESEFIQNVYVGNRDQILEGVFQRIGEGYWLIGLTFEKPIFYRYGYREIIPLSTTDTTFINILLRYGIIPLTISIFICIRLFKRSKHPFYTFTALIYIIASLNIDSLLRHNSILFLTLILAIVIYEKRK